MTPKQKRAEQVKAGVYDGRYRTRIVADKKKAAKKNACRHKGRGDTNISQEES